MAGSDAPIFVDMPALLAHFGVTTTDELVEDVIDNELDSYVDLFFEADGEWVLYLTTPNLVRYAATNFEFPMTEATFWEFVHDLDDEVMGVE